MLRYLVRSNWDQFFPCSSIYFTAIKSVFGIFLLKFLFQQFPFIYSDIILSLWFLQCQKIKYFYMFFSTEFKSKLVLNSKVFKKIQIPSLAFHFCNHWGNFWKAALCIFTVKLKTHCNIVVYIWHTAIWKTRLFKCHMVTGKTSRRLIALGTSFKSKSIFSTSFSFFVLEAQLHSWQICISLIILCFQEWKDVKKVIDFVPTHHEQ